MACASFVKLNASSSQWIGQQPFSNRRHGSTRSVTRRLAVPIRAGSYSEELVKTACLSKSSLESRYSVWAKERTRLQILLRRCSFARSLFFCQVTTIRMSGSKAVIGLSWEPKLPTFSTSSLSSDKQKSQNHAVAGSLWKPSTELVDGLFVPPNDPKKLNKLLRKQVKDTTGRNWFDMPAPTITPELKKDLQLLKLRNVMDPKRHYKKGSSKLKELPKYFQVGTVIESPVDFFTGRLINKERKQSLAEELLADGALAAYRKRKVREIDEELRPGGVDMWKIRGKQSLKRAKQRRH